MSGWDARTEAHAAGLRAALGTACVAARLRKYKHHVPRSTHHATIGERPALVKTSTPGTVRFTRARNPPLAGSLTAGTAARRSSMCFACASSAAYARRERSSSTLAPLGGASPKKAASSGLAFIRHSQCSAISASIAAATVSGKFACRLAAARTAMAAVAPTDKRTAASALRVAIVSEWIKHKKEWVDTRHDPRFLVRLKRPWGAVIGASGDRDF